MAVCEYFEGCVFFNNNIPRDSPLGVLFGKNYCKKSYSDCARYKVLKNLGNQYLPHAMDPTMHDKANEIIRRGAY